MPKPEKHIFVCMQSRPMWHPRPSCERKNCNEIADEFYKQLEGRQLVEKIQVTTTGCLGPCMNGPTVLVYPEGVMYGGLKKEDVNTIFDEHILKDEPVESLMMPKEVWG